jgi:hypothetical protein
MRLMLVVFVGESLKWFYEKVAVVEYFYLACIVGDEETV